MPGRSGATGHVPRRHVKPVAGAAGAVLAFAVALFAASPASAVQGGDVPTSGGWATTGSVHTTACRVVGSSVVGGEAKFEVGPHGCTGTVGPLSFSTYTLKDGKVLPFESQVVFAHAAGNGKSYGEGSYKLTAPLPRCAWQSDFYIGVNQPSAPHIHPLTGMNVGWDFREGTCASPPPVAPSPKPTCTKTATPRPTASPSQKPSPTPTSPSEPTSTATPTPTATLTATPTATPTGRPTATPTATPTPTPSGSPTYVSQVLDAPATTPSPSPSTTYASDVLAAEPNLAATGSTVAPVVGGAVILLLAGCVLLVIRRRAGQGS